ncbi:MAG: response regulator [Candidatus Scalinduaceae bacterium]
MSKTSVLLADDHPIVRKGIKALLDVQDDINVIGEAKDGREAIEKAKQMVPDLVIIDIMMPDLNGIEALREIKRAIPETKVLVLTMYDDEDFINQTLQSGASGYLLKESAVSDLISAIEAIMKGDTFLSPRVSNVLVKDFIGHGVTKNSKDLNPSLLTKREREILQLLAEGNSNKEIAHKINLSIRTVDSHRASIMGKLHIHDITGLVKYAIKKNLIKV